MQAYIYFTKFNGRHEDNSAHTCDLTFNRRQTLSSSVPTCVLRTAALKPCIPRALIDPLLLYSMSHHHHHTTTVNLQTPFREVPLDVVTIAGEVEYPRPLSGQFMRGDLPREYPSGVFSTLTTKCT